MGREGKQLRAGIVPMILADVVRIGTKDIYGEFNDRETKTTLKLRDSKIHMHCAVAGQRHIFQSDARIGLFLET